MRLALASALLVAGTLEAFEPTFTPDSLAEAISIGRTGIEARRVEFHRPYRLIIGQPPLDYVDVITPFRRIVLAAEARLLRGERLFGQREAVAALGESPEQLDLRLELTFNPLNTFIGVPDYTVNLVSVADRRPVEVITVDRFPRFGPRVDGQRSDSAQVAGISRGQSQPLLGGTIIAVFDGRRLDSRGVYEVTVAEAGKVLATGRIDFSTVR